MSVPSQSSKREAVSVPSVPLLPSQDFSDKSDYLRHVAREALAQQKAVNPFLDEPLMLIDLYQVEKQLQQWQKLLPRITPYYAIKCNPDPNVVRVLAKGGANFDCATVQEMRLCKEVVGTCKDCVVYANPLKLPSHIFAAKELSVDLTTFDSVAELHKMSRLFPTARLLIRLSVEDSKSVCPMSCKFGASEGGVERLLKTARELGLRVVGVSFHVGSGCRDPASFTRAISAARRTFDLALQLNMGEMTVLDIGGGFPGSDPAGFEVMARGIRDLVDREFPAHVNVIAEPGRYMVTTSHCLITQVHSKADRREEGDRDRYYVSDSLYGSFNCVLYDHQTLSPIPLSPRAGQAEPCTIFGRTCDGFDCVMEKCEALPPMEVNDFLLWPNMGAYTTAAGTTFNGFEYPKVWYYRSQ